MWERGQQRWHWARQLTLLPPLLLACAGRGRVREKKVHSFSFQILLNSLRLAAEAGFLDVDLLVLFYFW